MDGVLVVSASEKSRAFLCGLLEGYPLPIRSASSAGEARRMLLSRSFSLAVINAPLGDEMGQELAMELSSEGTGALLIVRSELQGEIAALAAQGGVCVLGKPFGRDAFEQALQLIFASNRRIARLREENEVLRRRIEENREIDRAKMALMQERGMTEPEAHRAIEKQAMDKRMSRRDVARDVLRAYPPK